MADFIVAAILVLVIGASVAYIVKSKKNGAKCIGCPHAGTCESKAQKDGDQGCGCGCQSDEHKS